MSKVFINELNEEQQKVVLHNKGPLIVLAGAGSGKTKALVYRVAYLLQNKNPENILLVTFTNKAAYEMQSRLMELSGARLPFAGTFHSFCAKLLRKEGENIEIPSNFIIYDSADQLSLMKLVMQKMGLNQKNYSPKAILHTISSAKNELIFQDEYRSFARGTYQEVVARCYKQYQIDLKSYNALDFDDLLFFSVQLLQRVPTVREKYSYQFEHILIDEYQDTNKAQYELTKLLAQQHQNLCVVGDASQAIYGWRGADYRNLLALQKDFSKVTVIELNQNYRSSQNILDAAYGIIGHNRTHPVLKLWTQKLQGDPITVYQAQSGEEEAIYVLSQIKKLKQKTPHLSLNEIAVLYRTNAQSRSLEEVFIRAGMPYTIIGGVQFYERKEVKDVLAYLNLIQNPNDGISRKRAEKIGKRRLLKLESKREEINLKSTPIEILDTILEITQYMNLYQQEIEEDLMRLENIRELRSVAHEFKTLTEFLENVVLVQNNFTPSGQKIRGAEGESVTFMTLHSSKGLEFNTIFMIGLEEGLFPHSRSLLSKDELEEERRLCYVGITRAKRQLFLSYARQRIYFGSYTSNMVSRFIAEIPEHVLTSKQHPLEINQNELVDSLLSGDIDIDAFLES